MSGTWTAVHLLYRDPGTRLELLTLHLSDLIEAVAPGVAWFFADLRSAAREGPGILEIGISRKSSQADAASSLIDAVRELSLGVEADPVNHPQVLDDRLFPSGSVPPVYGSGLAIGAARSLIILRAVQGSTRAAAPWSSVRAEVLETNRCLFPWAPGRRAARADHIAWLGRVVGLHSRSAAETGIIDEESRALVGKDELPDYGPLVEEIHRLPSPDKMVAAARLAHIQVVRLRGPENADLRTEALLVQSMVQEHDVEQR
jgi:hypothetical protein